MKGKKEDKEICSKNNEREILLALKVKSYDLHVTEINVLKLHFLFLLCSEKFIFDSAHTVADMKITTKVRGLGSFSKV